jgi:pantoate--beta-alanine ligase
MKIIETVSEIKKQLGQLNHKPVGFVPTMGALHDGHLSLVKTAVSECPSVIVSIFVNPTQFNDKEDLKNYPRTEKEDIEMLTEALRDNDILFLPEVAEIYPEEDRRVFNFGDLENVMEGIHRPGHFNGVAQVVSRLFDIVNPDRAYFGQKDFQQLTIVRELVRQTGRKTQIIGCPIVREPDGLAMSSRNRLLDLNTREKAGIIFKTISEAAIMLRDSEIDEIKKFVKRQINGTEGFSLEYFEIVDDKDLQPLKRNKDLIKDKRYFCCIALRAGKIRLIDNVEISLL